MKFKNIILATLMVCATAPLMSMEHTLLFDNLEGALGDYRKFQTLKEGVSFKEKNDKSLPYKVTKFNPIKFREPNLEYRPGGQSGCIDTNEESIEFSRPVLLVGGIPLGIQHGIVTHESAFLYLASREKDKEKRASGEISESYGDGETRGTPIGGASSVRFKLWTNPTKYGWAAIGGITAAAVGCAAYLSGLFSKK
jgi:hypothetical protein